MLSLKSETDDGTEFGARLFEMFSDINRSIEASDEEITRVLLQIATGEATALPVDDRDQVALSDLINQVGGHNEYGIYKPWHITTSIILKASAHSFER